MAVFHCGFELPVLHRFDGFFVEAHAQAAEHANIGRTSVNPHDEAQRAHTLVLGLAGFLREFRLWRVNRSRRTDASANVEYSSTGAATLTGAEARTTAGTHATTTARTDAAAGARAVRGQHGARHGIAEVRHVIRGQHDLRRDDDRGIDRKLGVLVAHHYHGRSDLLHGKLGQLAFAGLQDVAISTTTATANLCLGRLQGGYVAGIDQGDGYLRRRSCIHDVASDQVACRDDPNDQQVYASRPQRAILPVVVETPDIFDWFGFRFQLQRWEFLRKEELIQLAE